MKVLLTGSSGFVGLNLEPYLKSNHVEIISLSRAELNSGVFDKLADVDAIVHLAGKAHDLRNSGDNQEYFTVNYELTKNLYREFLSSKVSKFIFLSSVKASADIVEDILSEEDEPCPETDYGRSKLLAEQFIQEQALPEGKSFYILRPCMIHGPGNKGNLNLLYKIISKGIPYPLAAFENKRSFLSVENLCFVINQMLSKSEIQSGIFNVADDDALSTNELVSLISTSIGRQARLLRLPQPIVISLAKIGDLFRLPLTSERLRKLTESYVVDNSKLKAALQSNLPVPTRQGIYTTIISFLSAKK